MFSQAAGGELLVAYTPTFLMAGTFGEAPTRRHQLTTRTVGVGIGGPPVRTG